MISSNSPSPENSRGKSIHSYVLGPINRSVGVTLIESKEKLDSCTIYFPRVFHLESEESGSRKTNALSGYDVIPRFIVFPLLVIDGGPRLFISLKREARIARKPEKATQRERNIERDR